MRMYATEGGEKHLVVWHKRTPGCIIHVTSACSGCTDDYSAWSNGCAECGFTGKRRRAEWVPFGEAVTADILQRVAAKRITRRKGKRT